MFKLLKSLHSPKIQLSSNSSFSPSIHLFSSVGYFSTSSPSNLTAEPHGEFKSTLMSRIKISPDTYIYKFDLPHKDLPLGLLPGQHVKIQYKTASYLWTN